MVANPTLSISNLKKGKHYRIGIAAELKTNNKRKEFIYVPYSRTIISKQTLNCDLKFLNKCKS